MGFVDVVWYGLIMGLVLGFFSRDWVKCLGYLWGGSWLVSKFVGLV